jgi:arylsulfatase A-like enzyme
MTRTLLSRRQALALPLLAGVGRLSAAERPPNIVVLLADDQGWGDLSINGNINVSTPRIDSIGREGAVFERFYVCAVCAPTRAEFLTGRYHARGGVRGTSAGAERLNLDERTIGQTFQAAGYATGAFGKWHNGSQFPYHPNARGFQEYYGVTEGHWANYFDTEMDHNGRLVRGKGFIADDLTDHAIEFIERRRRDPFFCYVPFNTPHSPMQVPDRFWEKFANFDPKMRARDPQLEQIPMTRAALAMTENLDWNVGRLLSRLDELNLRDNTIVMYFSDNGPNSWRWNGGMKGRKGSVDEGGVRAPFVIRWPGRIRPGTRVSRIAGAIDLLPTLADLSGIPVKSDKPLDGKSVKPLLLGEAANWPDRMILSLEGRQISVRTDQYRLDPKGQLYDMVADPMQDRDVSKDKPEIAARLQLAAADWGKEMLPLVGPDDRPYPVGFAKSTILPAGHGVAEGGVERSNRFPNSSYFTRWTDTKGRMTWEVEVAETGRYDADLYYTASTPGSTVELSFLDATIRKKIAEAWDPPLIGAAQDRVPRSESYTKDFKPLRLGAISLKKGRGKLTLRAVEVAGKEVAEVRYLVLTRRG